MSDDMPARLVDETGIYRYYVNPREKKGYVLYGIQAILDGFGRTLREYGLPNPPSHLLQELKNKLLMEEKNYNRQMLHDETIDALPKLNSRQREVFDLIMSSVQ